MSDKRNSHQYVVCVRNDGFRASLVVRRIYRCLPDPEAAKRKLVRVIDESGEFDAGNTETGSTPVALAPSPQALAFLLRQAGFRRTEILPPPPNAYEQHARGNANGKPIVPFQLKGRSVRGGAIAHHAAVPMLGQRYLLAL